MFRTVWGDPPLTIGVTTETVERVKAYILADPDILDDKTKFVEGWGWDHTKWLLEEWPTYVRLITIPKRPRWH